MGGGDPCSLRGQDAVGADLLLHRLNPIQHLRPLQPVALEPFLPDSLPPLDNLRGLVLPKNVKAPWGGLSPLSTEPRESPGSNLHLWLGYWVLGMSPGRRMLG